MLSMCLFDYDMMLVRHLGSYSITLVNSDHDRFRDKSSERKHTILIDRWNLNDRNDRNDRDGDVSSDHDCFHDESFLYKHNVLF